MSLRIRPPINAPDEWFDKVESAFDSKVNEAAKPSTPIPADVPISVDAKSTLPPLDENPVSFTYVGRKPIGAAKPRKPKPELRSAPLQDYGERLVKLIPSEVVGIYLIGVGVIPAAAKISVTVWAVVCLGLVVLARAYATKEPALNLPPQWKAVVISSISFVIWVYTIPGPFQSLGLAVPYMGSLAILVWTFVVPYFYRGA